MLTETLVDILHFLDADTLDTIDIASKEFNSLVKAHNNIIPLHNVMRFSVFDDGVDRVLDDENVANLDHIMRQVSIQTVYFHCVITDAIIDSLLPHVANFRNATCHAPWRYASADIITRTFTDLLFCRVITVDTLSVQGVDSSWAYDSEEPFVSLPCIRNCELLCVLDIFVSKQDFTTNMMAWLHSGGEKKRLTLECNVTHMSLHSRSARLFENFENASTPCEYELALIYPENITIRDRKKMNNLTNEELTLSYNRCATSNKVIFVRRRVHQ
ncbi:hypothetical protein AAVH_15930 [Aphelenchoides avenae]|nr:hypothetical protein AAVH_15930 [Aphelenchus avenae]